MQGHIDKSKGHPPDDGEVDDRRRQRQHHLHGRVGPDVVDHLVVDRDQLGERAGDNAQDYDDKVGLDGLDRCRKFLLVLLDDLLVPKFIISEYAEVILICSNLGYGIRTRGWMILSLTNDEDVDIRRQLNLPTTSFSPGLGLSLGIDLGRFLDGLKEDEVEAAADQHREVKDDRRDADDDALDLFRQLVKEVLLWPAVSHRAGDEEAEDGGDDDEERPDDGRHRTLPETSNIRPRVVNPVRSCDLKSVSRI